MTYRADHPRKSIVQSPAEASHLVLLASPSAASSSWVNQELGRWIAGGQMRNLSVILVRGELREAIPPALLEYFRRSEIPWFNLFDIRDATQRPDHVDGKEPELRRAVSRTVAFVLGRDEPEEKMRLPILDYNRAVQAILKDGLTRVVSLSEPQGSSVRLSAYRIKRRKPTAVRLDPLGTISLGVFESDSGLTTAALHFLPRDISYGFTHETSELLRRTVIVPIHNYDSGLVLLESGSSHVDSPRMRSILVGVSWRLESLGSPPVGWRHLLNR